MATFAIRRPSVASTSTAAPPYELTTLRSSSRSSSSYSLDASLPPDYDDLDIGADPFAGPLGTGSRAPFVPTQKLRIDCLGHAALSLPIPPRPDPIPIYDITHTHAPATADGAEESFRELPDAIVPLYTSFRRARGSGTCELKAGYDPTSDVLVSTTYRFGPGKPPIVTLHSGNGTTTSSSIAGRASSPAPSASSSSSSSRPEAPAPLSSSDDSFAIKSKSAFHRTLVFRTRFGTFTWRYASRAERKAANANSLVILERVVAVAHAPASSTSATTAAAAAASSSSASSSVFSSARRRPVAETTDVVVAEVARFVRSDQTRTPGTSKHTAGNGGLLLLDLSPWQGEKTDPADAEEVRRLAVASCISLMKKEVDRRRVQQMMTMAAVIGGGS